MKLTRAGWARQHGEAKVREFGFSRLPINPFEIARQEDIIIEPKPAAAEGVSGGMLFLDGDVGIFYTTSINNTGFKNFTVGHELGHYFLPGHPEALRAISPVHLSRAGFSQGDQSIEIEADHFASGLLMPRKLIRKEILEHNIGLEAVFGVAEAARCSLTASAIRVAECSEYPIAIIVSRGTAIQYGFLSSAFKKLGRLSFPRKGDVLPRTITREFNSQPTNVIYGETATGRTSAAEWFDGTNVALDEQVVGLGRHGLTLTVLSSDELREDPDEFEDEETALIESWTPKFARGR